MEQRIQQIVSRFSILRKEQSLNTNSNPKIVLKEKDDIVVKVVKEVVNKSSAYQKPLMMKKINQYRQELSKNNLKKQQQTFVFHGNIDDYEKELDNRIVLDKEID
jgi:hypothetical protein